MTLELINGANAGTCRQDGLQVIDLEVVGGDHKNIFLLYRMSNAVATGEALCAYLWSKPLTGYFLGAGRVHWPPFVMIAAAVTGEFSARRVSTVEPSRACWQLMKR